MSTKKRSETPQEYHDRLLDHLNGTPVMLWKTAKSLLYSTFLFVPTIYAIEAAGAQPYPLIAIPTVLSAAIFLGEIKEVEFANLVTLTFKRANGKR